jgi:hypothetical protein
VDARVGVHLWARIRFYSMLDFCRAHVGQSIRHELANWPATVRRLLQKRQHVVRNHAELSVTRLDKWWQLTYCGLFFSWCTFCQSASNHFSTIAAQQSQTVAHQLVITYKPSEDQIRHRLSEKRSIGDVFYLPGGIAPLSESLSHFLPILC